MRRRNRFSQTLKLSSDRDVFQDTPLFNIQINKPSSKDDGLLILLG
jgi:hypothetical protein